MSCPENLPKCIYPKASDLEDYGLIELPDSLPLVDWDGIKKYRSSQYKTVPLSQFSNSKVLEMARMIADSFGKNEPMKRHLQPPLKTPTEVLNHIHLDSFGKEGFGEWTAANVVYWYMRLFILTNPSDAVENINVNTDTLNLSLAITNNSSTIIGGALNYLNKPEEIPYRNEDPFIDAVMVIDKPILNLISTLEKEGIDALKERYPHFDQALRNGKVGSHAMIARSSELPKEDTFELVAASAETLKSRGFEYLLVTASNQWTGAACEVLNGTRVNFIPFRNIQKVPMKENASLYETFSVDGYLSAKDSGAMFYILKL
jgi:hypothetical protein